ncbi:unnamed protein product [Zymoseptoria tritici ST99CH_1E4]|uniref:Protein kinase domain-containing protein n=1 Tax=Zymoseptoria tritici ST99CH_1E4 TaxID=1276532 RepID=A0A2H1GQ73_ZYMTR|nr:unnamed protein product [Zymoseptoria tritici ST99CH_1E4]
MRELGQGTFGKVYMERCIKGEREQQVHAVKRIRKTEDYDWTWELRAVALFSAERFRNFFVESTGWYESNSHIYITMEFLEHGDLQKFLALPLPELEAQTIMFQVLQGLKAMHDQGFAHRDLKPGNIMVAAPGPDWWIKIADFGICKRATAGITELRSALGTLTYMAPEIHGLIGEDHDARQYTDAVDLWAAGVIAHVILANKTPFPDMGSLTRYATGLSMFPVETLLAQAISDAGCDFVHQCVMRNPSERPEASVALRHPWFARLNQIASGSVNGFIYDTGVDSDGVSILTASDADNTSSTGVAGPLTAKTTSTEYSATWRTNDVDFREPLLQSLEGDAASNRASTMDVSAADPASSVYDTAPLLGTSRHGKCDPWMDTTGEDSCEDKAVVSVGLSEKAFVAAEQGGAHFASSKVPAGPLGRAWNLFDKDNLGPVVKPVHAVHDTSSGIRSPGNLPPARGSVAFHVPHEELPKVVEICSRRPNASDIQDEEWKSSQPIKPFRAAPPAPLGSPDGNGSLATSNDDAHDHDTMGPVPPAISLADASPVESRNATAVRRRSVQPTADAEETNERQKSPTSPPYIEHAAHQSKSTTLSGRELKEILSDLDSLHVASKPVSTRAQMPDPQAQSLERKLELNSQASEMGVFANRISELQLRNNMNRQPAQHQGRAEFGDHFQ